MTALALALAVAAVCWTWHRTLTACLPRVDRWLDIQAPKPLLNEEKVPVPVDLLLKAQTDYEEKWAQEQQVGYYRELFADTGDWDTVRRVVNG